MTQEPAPTAEWHPSVSALDIDPAHTSLAIAAAPASEDPLGVELAVYADALVSSGIPASYCFFIESTPDTRPALRLRISAPTRALAEVARDHAARCGKSVIPNASFASVETSSTAQILDGKAATAFSFRVEQEGPMWPLSVESPVGRALQSADGSWRLTITVGPPSPESSTVENSFEPPKLSLGMSLVGTGLDGPLIGRLLQSEMGGFGCLIAEQHHGREALDIANAQLIGEAPLVGDVPLPVVGRLLSITARTPEPRSMPSGPAVITELLDIVPPHLWVLGGTGMGKTTLLEHLVVAEMEMGRSVIVIDPHGDLAPRVASHAACLGVDAVGLDLGDRSGFRWNLSVPPEGTDPARWAPQLAQVVWNELWHDMPAEFQGPVGQRALNTALSVLVRDPEGPQPLTRMPELLDPRDSEFRDTALERIDDESLTRQVQRELMPLVRSDDNGYIWLAAKLEALIGDPTVASIIGARESDFEARWVDGSTNLIVSLGSGSLSASGRRVFAAMVLSHASLSSLGRERSNRSPVSIYVDEWQSVPAPVIGRGLAEGRKFGLYWRLSNQHVTQIRPTLRDAVLGNVGAIATFRTGPVDAALLSGSFPSLDADRLRTLPRHWLAVTKGDHDFVAAAPRPLRLLVEETEVPYGDLLRPGEQTRLPI